MIATLFLLLGLLFSWMVYRALAEGELEARGWGFSTRIYSRDEEPIKYWVTFSCYAFCAVAGLIAALLLALGRLR